MLDLQMPILHTVITRTQQNVAATQPAWAAVIGQAARQLVINKRHISAYEHGILHIEVGSRAIDASSDSCTCHAFRRWRTCEHRLIAWLYQLYCDELGTHRP